MFGNKRLDKTFDTVRRAEYTPASRLAKASGVTERTVRSDIKKINRMLEGHGAKIGMRRERGYFLEVDDQAAYAAFVQSSELQGGRPGLDITSSEGRIRYLLREFLEADDYLSYPSLAEAVYVGDNTLQNYVRQIKDILAEYNLALIVKPGVGAKVVGREADRRRCFMERVVTRNMSTYVKGFTADEQRLFPNVDLDLLERTMRDHLDTDVVVTGDYGFKNLLVHAALMLDRIRRGCPIEGSGDVVMEPRVSYLIDSLCDDLERTFSLEIAQPERDYLYLHLLANTTLTGIDINDKLLESDIDAMLEIVWQSYGFDLRDDEALKRNLLNHLSSTFMSKDLDVIKQNPLLNTIKTNFPLAFEIAVASTSKVFDSEPHTLTEDEVGYIALHIGAAIERRTPTSREPIHALVVCGSGTSVQQMLRSRIETLFVGRITIEGVVTYQQFSQMQATGLAGMDLIVTTVPLERRAQPVVQVDFSLGPSDTEALTRAVNEVERRRATSADAFFDPALFCVVDEPLDKARVLERLCDLLVQAGVVDGNFLGSVLEREEVSATDMGPSFAIPHSMKPISRRTQVAVAILRDPVRWNDDAQEVQIVFLLAVRPGDRTNIEILYDQLIEVTNNRQMQQRIMAAASYDEFLEAMHAQG